MTDDQREAIRVEAKRVASETLQRLAEMYEGDEELCPCPACSGYWGEDEEEGGEP